MLQQCFSFYLSLTHQETSAGLDDLADLTLRV